jgi:hypothetical protein
MKNYSIKYLQTNSKNTSKRSSIIIKWASSQRCKNYSIHKSKHPQSTYKQNERKSHMIISLGTEKASDKVQHTFKIKFLERWKIKEKILQHNKACLQQFHIKLNGETLKAILLKPGTTGCSLSPYLFNRVFEVLTRAIKQLNKIKETQNGEKSSYPYLQTIRYYICDTKSSVMELLQLINTFIKWLNTKLTKKTNTKQ